MSNTTLHIVNINGKYQINDINGIITAHNISNDILTLRINGKSYSATIGESSPICISCTSSDPESKPDDGNTFSFSIKAEDIDGDIIDSRITMSLRTEFIVNGEIKRIFFKEWKTLIKTDNFLDGVIILDEIFGCVDSATGEVNADYMTRELCESANEFGISSLNWLLIKDNRIEFDYGAFNFNNLDTAAIGCIDPLAIPCTEDGTDGVSCYDSCHIYQPHSINCNYSISISCGDDTACTCSDDICAAYCKWCGTSEEFRCRMAPYNFYNAYETSEITSDCTFRYDVQQVTKIGFLSDTFDNFKLVQPYEDSYDIAKVYTDFIFDSNFDIVNSLVDSTITSYEDYKDYYQDRVEGEFEGDASIGVDSHDAPGGTNCNDSENYTLCNRIPHFDKNGDELEIKITPARYLPNLIDEVQYPIGFYFEIHKLLLKGICLWDGDIQSPRKTCQGGNNAGNSCDNHEECAPPNETIIITDSEGNDVFDGIINLQISQDIDDMRVIVTGQITHDVSITDYIFKFPYRVNGLITLHTCMKNITFFDNDGVEIFHLTDTEGSYHTCFDIYPDLELSPMMGYPTDCVNEFTFDHDVSCDVHSPTSRSNPGHYQTYNERMCLKKKGCTLRMMGTRIGKLQQGLYSQQVSLTNGTPKWIGMYQNPFFGTNFNVVSSFVGLTASNQWLADSYVVEYGTPSEFRLFTHGDDKFQCLYSTDSTCTIYGTPDNKLTGYFSGGYGGDIDTDEGAENSPKSALFISYMPTNSNVDWPTILDRYYLKVSNWMWSGNDYHIGYGGLLDMFMDRVDSNIIFPRYNLNHTIHIDEYYMDGDYIDRTDFYIESFGFLTHFNYETYPSEFPKIMWNSINHKTDRTDALSYHMRGTDEQLYHDYYNTSKPLFPTRYPAKRPSGETHPYYGKPIYGMDLNVIPNPVIRDLRHHSIINRHTDFVNSRYIILCEPKDEYFQNDNWLTEIPLNENSCIGVKTNHEYISTDFNDFISIDDWLTNHPDLTDDIFKSDWEYYYRNEFSIYEDSPLLTSLVPACKEYLYQSHATLLSFDPEDNSNEIYRIEYETELISHVDEDYDDLYDTWLGTKVDLRAGEGYKIYHNTLNVKDETPGFSYPFRTAMHYDSCGICSGGDTLHTANSNVDDLGNCCLYPNKITNRYEADIAYISGVGKTYKNLKQICSDYINEDGTTTYTDITTGKQFFDVHDGCRGYVDCNGICHRDIQLINPDEIQYAYNDVNVARHDIYGNCCLQGNIDYCGVCDGYSELYTDDVNPEEICGPNTINCPADSYEPVVIDVDTIAQANNDITNSGQFTIKIQSNEIIKESLIPISGVDIQNVILTLNPENSDYYISFIGDDIYISSYGLDSSISATTIISITIIYSGINSADVCIGSEFKIETILDEVLHTNIFCGAGEGDIASGNWDAQYCSVGGFETVENNHCFRSIGDSDWAYNGCSDSTALNYDYNCVDFDNTSCDYNDCTYTSDGFLEILDIYFNTGADGIDGMSGIADLDYWLTDSGWTDSSTTTGLLNGLLSPTGSFLNREWAIAHYELEQEYPNGTDLTDEFMFLDDFFTTPTTYTEPVSNISYTDLDDWLITQSDSDIYQNLNDTMDLFFDSSYCEDPTLCGQSYCQTEYTLYTEAECISDYAAIIAANDFDFLTLFYETADNPLFVDGSGVTWFDLDAWLIDKGAVSLESNIPGVLEQFGTNAIEYDYTIHSYYTFIGFRNKDMYFISNLYEEDISLNGVSTTYKLQDFYSVPFTYDPVYADASGVPTDKIIITDDDGSITGTSGLNLNCTYQNDGSWRIIDSSAAGIIRQDIIIKPGQSFLFQAVKTELRQDTSYGHFNFTEPIES
jgi:hypothetical protein